MSPQNEAIIWKYATQSEHLLCGVFLLMDGCEREIAAPGARNYEHHLNCLYIYVERHLGTNTPAKRIICRRARSLNFYESLAQAIVFTLRCEWQNICI